VRRKAAILFLALLCLTLGLITAFYFPIPAGVGAVVTKLLQGKIRPFSVKRNFREIIAYVTDRKAGPTVDGNVTYLGQYAGKVSYRLITVQFTTITRQHNDICSNIRMHKTQPITGQSRLNFALLLSLIAQ
jgi:hypothetical protein